ncbi:peptidoglycan D,D-transpeptidase FtsI family protein [Spirillospora sp. CA-294931]|uniref:peptidoglycan D,D-transpeptidase FtsI family protein n=1 Tax=Spirillospora sp. CA-294931 TaxID=3240042 RepID=UPI003D92740A
MTMDKPLRRVAIFALLLIFGLMAQINYVQGSRADDLQNDANNQRRFQDIFSAERGRILADGQALASSTETGKDRPKYGRSYTEGPLFSPVTGMFSSSGSASKIELAYNSLLGGRDKRITNQRWFDTFIGKKAEGADLELALDTKAQAVAYNRLKAQTLAGRRGGAAVIDIRTGAIKVLASFPSYDPNEVAPQTGLQGAKRLKQLDKGQGVVKPLIDNAMSQTFPPGSTFKIVTAALAMENNGLDKSSMVHTGRYHLPESGTLFKNSHDTGHCASRAPLVDAFAESCNSTFGRLAVTMGIDKLNAGAGRFGFNQPIAVEPNVSAAEGDVPVNTTVKDASGQPKTIKTGADSTARSGIGQENVRSTPLQMAMVASAVANDGTMMKPYLVEKVRAKDGSELYTVRPKVLGKPIKKRTAEQLQEMMRAVVSQGTAKNLQGMRIAGKTGTAETDLVSKINARWFVGFSPIENPRYAFAVMTEGRDSGGTHAGPTAAAIMTELLKP